MASPNKEYLKSGGWFGEPNASWAGLSAAGDGLDVAGGSEERDSGSSASHTGLNLLLRKLQSRVCHGWQHKPLDAFGNSGLRFHLKVPLPLNQPAL